MLGILEGNVIYEKKKLLVIYEVVLIVIFWHPISSMNYFFKHCNTYNLWKKDILINFLTLINFYQCVESNFPMCIVLPLEKPGSPDQLD